MNFHDMESSEFSSVVINGDEEPNLTGNVKAADDPSTLNTLDEPVMETLMRDVKAVGNKFFHVLKPIEEKTLLQDWDLWGPLILCTIMATVLHQSDIPSGDVIGGYGPQFTEVFVIVWLGSLAVTLNTKFLGGRISFFQSTCVVGYCILPLALGLIVSKALLLVFNHTIFIFVVRCIIVLAAFAWANYASTKFMGDIPPVDRRKLAAYPIGLFYFLISWMVLSAT